MRYAARRTLQVRLLTALAAGGLAAAAAVTAGAQETRTEQVVKYRQAMYRILGANFAPLGNMASGRQPFDPGEFATRAERVNFVATMLYEGFPKEATTGVPSKARPEIWQDRAEFDELLTALQARTAELVQAARTEDAAKIRPAFAAAARACKNCHDRFRLE